MAHIVVIFSIRHSDNEGWSCAGPVGFFCGRTSAQVGSTDYTNCSLDPKNVKKQLVH
jgi:hypothetical protein